MVLVEKKRNDCWNLGRTLRYVGSLVDASLHTGEASKARP